MARIIRVCCGDLELWLIVARGSLPRLGFVGLR
jgi:hypothetical protein